MPITWSNSHPGIEVDGDQAFVAKTFATLDKLNLKPIGKDLLKLLSKRCQGYGCTIPGGGFVIIRLAPGTLVQSAGKTQAAPRQGVTAVQSDKVIPGTIIKLPGKGSGSIAQYNPDAEALYTAMVGITTPVHIALGHELCHSLHHLSGGLRLGAGVTLVDKFKAMYLQEEAHTVGLGPYKKTRICENALRKEWNLPERTYYSAPGDCDALPSLGGSSD